MPSLVPKRSRPDSAGAPPRRSASSWYTFLALRMRVANATHFGWLAKHVPNDVQLAVLINAVVLAGTIVHPLSPLGVVASALLCAPLAWRRRFPLGVLGVVASGVPVFLAVSDPSPLFFPPAFVALYTVAAWGSRERTLGIAAACIPYLALVVVGFAPEAEDGGFLTQLLEGLSQAGIALAIGEAVRSQRAFRAAVRDRADRAAREHELETRQKLDEERVRIAQDVHDLVAHNLATISTQASVGVHIGQAEPARAIDALESIKSVSAQALNELRYALGTLRDPSGGALHAPTPSLHDVPALVQRARDSGMAVQLRMEGAPAPLPATVEVAIFRIVQEGLTNVMRHARGAHAVVRVAVRGDRVEVEVSNDGSGTPTEWSRAGTGSGLVGMRERANAVGGQLRVEPRADGGFRVRTLLPLERIPT